MNMGILDIIVTTFGASALLAFATYLFKNMLIERLKASVQHEFNEKLAILQNKLQKKGEELNSLRSNLLNGVSERQKLLYSKKIEAVEMIWSNVQALAAGRLVATQTKLLNYKEALEQSEQDAKVQEFFKSIFPDHALKEFNIDNAYLARPYLSEYAWVLFKAYSSIISTYLIRAEILKIGTGTDLGDSEFTLEIVNAALPEYKAYIDKHKMEGAYYLLEELESRILKELKAILDGNDDDTKHMNTITALNKALKEAEKKVPEPS